MGYPWQAHLAEGLPERIITLEPVWKALIEEIIARSTMSEDYIAPEGAKVTDRW